MSLSSDELKEFINEGQDLLDQAEQGLLAIDEGADFKSNYDAIFRAFHSIKGAAGMLGLSDLQAHLHQLETTFTGLKNESNLSKAHTDFFLRGVDASRDLLNGKPVSFQYDIGSAAPKDTKSAAERVAARKERPHPLLNATAKPAHKGRILLVDDDEGVLTALSSTLSGKNFHTLAVSDPRRAVEAAKGYLPDLVLCDVRMPVMTGPMVLREMRAVFPDIPFAFLSGYVDKDVLIDAVPHDLFQVLEKPFSPTDLVKLCERALSQPRAVRLLSKSIDLLMCRYTELGQRIQNGEDPLKISLERRISDLLTQSQDLFGSVRAHAQSAAATTEPEDAKKKTGPSG